MQGKKQNKARLGVVYAASEQEQEAVKAACDALGKGFSEVARLALAEYLKLELPKLQHGGHNKKQD